MQFLYLKFDTCYKPDRKMDVRLTQILNLFSLASQYSTRNKTVLILWKKCTRNSSFSEKSSNKAGLMFHYIFKLMYYFCAINKQHLYPPQWYCCHEQMKKNCVVVVNTHVKSAQFLEPLLWIPPTQDLSILQ